MTKCLPGRLLLLSLAFAGLCLLSHPSRAETRENKRLEAGKITKNEAQHLVLKKFPQARVKDCELRSAGTGHSVWIITVIKPNEKNLTRIEVDGETGRIKP